ncbi:MAG: hypothetical protein ACKN9D_03030, partial [Actinomycetales bacterium]
TLISGADDLDRNRAVVITGVQHLQIRDLVASLVIMDPDRAALINAVTDAALVAPQPWMPRIAGLAAALHAAHDSSSIPGSTLAELSGSDSLGELVLHSLAAALPPQAMEAILRESLPYTMAKIIAADTQHTNTNTPPGDNTANTADTDNPGTAKTADPVTAETAQPVAANHPQ